MGAMIREILRCRGIVLPVKLWDFTLGWYTLQFLNNSDINDIETQEEI